MQGFDPGTQNVDAAARQSRSRIRGLIVLNGLLLAALAAVTFGSSVHAQNRNRGEYTMVSGGANGALGAATYVVDVQNQEMIAITLNPQTKLVEGIGYRNLNADAASVMKSHTRPAN